MRSLLALLLLASPLVAQPEGRTKVRLLYSFENPAEAAELTRQAEQVDLAVVQDNGVTDGRNCLRLTVRKGVDYGLFHLGPKVVKDWQDYDCFAVDVFADDDRAYDVNFELWDAQTKNYATRFTQSLKTHRGRQTLLFPINRAKRNGKEGRDWDELEPKDKIDLRNLTRVKVFLTPGKDRDCVLWIDNIRLMQEDAARPKMKVPLPKEAIAFDFGSPGAVVPGFKSVSAATAWNERVGFGFTAGDGRVNGGEGWPDLLTGTFVSAPHANRMTFQARVPDGEYHVWLAAGRIIRADVPSPRFLLAINDDKICDETVSESELLGRKHMGRFLGTPYSEKPHAIWHNYINVMYPVHQRRIKVTDGKVRLESQGHFLGALVLVPASHEEAFARLSKEIEQARIAAFEKTYHAEAKPRPKAEATDGKSVLFVPHALRTIVPWSAPSREERENKLDAAGAPGQRLALRLALTPFADLGRCTMTPGDLKNDAGDVLPASKARVYVQHYRGDGKDVSEMGLLPGRSVVVEKGVTWCWWMWLEIPADAKPGVYRGNIDFATESEPLRKVPITIEVHPFKLRTDIPLSLGMYFGEPRTPALPGKDRKKVLKDLLTWMREIGFTGVTVPPPSVTGVGNGKVTMRFDPTLHDLAREVGMGARPEQMSMGSVLGIGRAIGRRLPGSIGAKVDQEPGIELRQPGFKELYIDGVRQYRDFIEERKLPVAVEIVDEPREVPNPWNRNLADTLTYAKYLADVPRLKGFVTPMGDSNGGKDYSVLADHVPIVSVHAWKASEKLIVRTKEKGRTLWLYNTGMDRFSWGFYNWRIGSAGRWEWHFSFPEDGATGGYPGREWYNPFTAVHGMASQAPWPEHRGGIVFQSAFLNVAEGITDSVYLHTLEETVKECKAAGKHAKTVAEAEAFLAELRKEIPEYPKLHGLTGEGDGALIGQGIKDSAAAKAGEWRMRIAKLLTTMTK